MVWQRVLLGVFPDFALCELESDSSQMLQIAVDGTVKLLYEEYKKRLWWPLVVCSKKLN